MKGPAALLYRAIRLLTNAAAAMAAASVLVMLALVAYSVGMRYLLNRPQVWVDEAVGFLLVGSVMLAVAEALRRGEHISIDLLTDRLGARGRRAAAVLGLLAVLATAAALLWEGWETVAFARMLGLMTEGYITLPLWQLQLLVPIGGALLLLACLAELLRIAAGLPPETAGRAHELKPRLD
jgi:TRAP-type C4-dicarboxylate transport system permease small subunit